jgi:hypothetical protein
VASAIRCDNPQRLFTFASQRRHERPPTVRMI